ncbi:lipopolysaccharide export system permease protein [Hydrocarboniphaga daqingensis]|uniref:Lipopolysaccharide export system permease protein LptF n=1 Tax=Hydrocarboniphaga daqingensis TaxID=490188 RepID=A0A1M5S5K7_9GAMM|nr:LPS export ABC transporter permease LptF [Hydrocarboniphaga daqingensis]SHH33710.1 lipopolysaccharide export system permease protein [Hydrocarboniphaga daqingensis]
MNGTTLDRYLLRDAATSWFAVTLVLLLIMLSTRFASLLGDAAAGELPRDLLFKIVGLSSLQYLVILVPVSLLLGLMLSLGRLYKDNEIAAMTGCGVSLFRLYRPFLTLGLLLSVFTALLAFQIGPWAGRTADYVVKDARRLIQYLPFEPGRFKSVADGRAVFYTSEMDKDREKLTSVFAQIETDQGVSVIVASEGRQRLNTETGDREISLYGGWRFDGRPGAPSYDILRFDEFTTRVTPPEFIYTGGKRKLMSTRDLWRSDDLQDRAELHWRIAAPLSVFLLTLLAVPLSHVGPRQGRYGKVVLGMVVYLFYSNLLGIGQNWIGKGKIPEAVGLWWVHAIVLGAALYLIGARLNWWQRRPLAPTMTAGSAGRA